MKDIIFAGQTDGDIDINVFVYYDNSISINYIKKVFQESINCTLCYKKDVNTSYDFRANIELTKRIMSKVDVFAIALTSSLFHMENEELSFLIEYANIKSIPILPIIFDQSVLEEYALNSVFKKMHYISCIKYNALFRRKIMNFFDEVIIDTPQREIIRKSFTGEVFLSYRRINRECADLLIENIHDYKPFRRLIVWNDYFLTPGVYFSSEIEKHIRDSKLCIVVITPDLLNNPDNYVVMSEYPYMVQQKKTIVGLVDSTINISLAKKEFPAISDFYNLNGKSEQYEGLSHEFGEFLANTFREELYGCSFSGNDWKKMGVAYLKGIFVERNPHLGVRMIEDTLYFEEIESGFKTLETIKKLQQYARNTYLNNENFIVVSELYRYAYDDLVNIEVTDENISLYHELIIEIIIGWVNALYEEGADDDQLVRFHEILSSSINPFTYAGKYKKDLLKAYNQLNIILTLSGDVLKAFEIRRKLLFLLALNENCYSLGFDTDYMLYVSNRKIGKSLLKSFILEIKLRKSLSDYEKAIIHFYQGLLLSVYGKKNVKAYRKFKDSYSCFKRVKVHYRDSEYYHQVSVLFLHIAELEYAWNNDSEKALNIIRKAKSYSRMAKEMYKDRKYYVFCCFIELLENYILQFGSKNKLKESLTHFSTLHTIYPENETFLQIARVLEKCLGNG